MISSSTEIQKWEVGRAGQGLVIILIPTLSISKVLCLASISLYNTLLKIYLVEPTYSGRLFYVEGLGMCEFASQNLKLKLP